MAEQRTVSVLWWTGTGRKSDACRSNEPARVHRGTRQRGGVAACGACAASGKAANRRVLGHDYAFDHEPMDRRFVGRLRELGWIEGSTIKIEYRWAEGRGERYAEIAAEFVGLKVVIVTTGPAALQAKRATSVIPIVLALSGDPVGAGLVANS